MGYNRNAYNKEHKRGGKSNRWDHERHEGRSKPSKEWSPDDIVGYEGEPDPVTVTVIFETILHVTDKGVKLMIAEEEMWVPKGQIVAADDGVMEVTLWIAEKSGWA